MDVAECGCRDGWFIFVVLETKTLAVSSTKGEGGRAGSPRICAEFMIPSLA